MATLQVFGGGPTTTRQKAVEDARKMEEAVQEECAKSGKPPPGYRLTELIGKGSFGRVYKANDLMTSQVVAVKIIDVDESDTVNPKLADTYSEILKEINALHRLSQSGAQNINHVIEALPVGKAMWMVTEYCAGGSVATLMKPTAPGGLQEKWIIPILREVAVAIYWVHKEGIIHRDIKCANVLVTETGAVQLCDFGVAGMMETKLDKRSTFIGTPHWMAPELFDQNAQYGTEVDIWAFGSMVYEIASGLPPNVRANVGLPQLGDYLREHLPRLDGDQYSDQLRDLVAFCLEENPSKRPSIERVQQHPYLFNTSSRYPASSLSNLVKAFKLWEERGGSRKSLFGAGGAQGPTDLGSTSLATDEWNFSTTLAFDEQLHDASDGRSDAEAVRDVYGSAVDFPSTFGEDTARPKALVKGRRRPPPQALAASKVKAPLEKVFDPNTISNYDENSRMYYGRLAPLAEPMTNELPASDLPLRDDSLHATLRESLIDLDASLGGGDLSNFVDMGTIRPGPQPQPQPPQPRPGPRASMDNNWSFSAATESTTHDRAPLSDPADMNGRHHAPDWSWPTSIPPASANPEMSHFTFNEDRTPDSLEGRPRLMHHPTEPIGLPSQGYDIQSTSTSTDRMSMTSLIDLDMSMPEPNLPELTRPSTANSDIGSIAGSDIGTREPFELERHASVYAPTNFSSREPSIYVSDGSEFSTQISNKIAEVSDVIQVHPHDEVDTITVQHHQQRGSDYTVASSETYVNDPRTDGPHSHLPIIPPPSSSVMEARATAGDVANEMRRLIGSLGDHLSIIGEQVAIMEPRRAGRSYEGAD
ncbi:kinase-like protein [Annulohypoxylon maeteangense]|uniref:kinase-like protein n=1 Tax=Annulohypoxylon maeteangense TaxID=1927788 RepID=UPI0020088661|nr:kinase-like protein [Annulohypoxylon maeteangense]KAI0890168.1 kinase-like protein [Annulohypoxylon maeteangense]